jgi:hypothetical protein
MKETLITMGVMIISLVSYLVACKVKGKASFSISNSFYKWFGWKRIWFILSMWGVGIPMLWLASTWDWAVSGMILWGQNLVVVAAIAVMLVGVFADYAASKFQEWMHVIPSYLCIGLGLIGTGLINFTEHWALGIMPLLGFISTSLLLKVDKTPNLIRWVEIAGFGYVLVSMIFMALK